MQLFRFFAVLIALVWLEPGVAGQTKDVTLVDPESQNFDFSLFYTGNIQGNIEPCG